MFASSLTLFYFRSCVATAEKNCVIVCEHIFDTHSSIVFGSVSLATAYSQAFAFAPTDW